MNYKIEIIENKFCDVEYFENLKSITRYEKEKKIKYEYNISVFFIKKFLSKFNQRKIKIFKNNIVDNKKNFDVEVIRHILDAKWHSKINVTINVKLKPNKTATN